jgi:cytoskeletal protein CcmA (bactofilin family)
MENGIESNLDLISSNDQGIVVVGEGVALEGKIDNAKDTNISGQYSGSISSDSLHISKGGKLKGDIKTQDIIIDGNFSGDIRAEKTLLVNSSGKIKGNFEYSNLEVKFGAVIEGMIKHSGSLSSFSPTVNYQSESEAKDTIEGDN